jgi:Zn-dependent M16 (insulinase) family peptidase
MERDESVIVFDSHGQLIDNIIRRMPARQLTDTYHLDLKDREYPFTLNVFACADPENEEERDRTRNRVMQAFEKLWPATQRGVYFKELLRHIIILLIENPGLTLTDVPKLLRDEVYRERYVSRLRNLGSRDFWEYDYGALTAR